MSHCSITRAAATRLALKRGKSVDFTTSPAIGSAMVSQRINLNRIKWLMVYGTFRSNYLERGTFVPIWNESVIRQAKEWAAQCVTTDGP
jgi:hypothetical protein